jgi:hypothetical protein
MDIRFDYARVLNFAKEALHLPDISYFEDIELNAYLSKVL